MIINFDNRDLIVKAKALILIKAIAEIGNFIVLLFVQIVRFIIKINIPRR